MIKTLPLCIEHKEMKTVSTLQNGFHESHDSNVNLHRMGTPLGCNQTTQNHRKVNVPLQEPRKYEDPTLQGPHKLIASDRQC